MIASQGILTGPGQTSIAASQIRTDGEPSPGGYFSAAYPLWDGTNRALVSWTLCRLLENEVIVPCTDERLADPEAEEAPPLYGVYVLDMDNNTLRPLTQPEEGIMYTDVVAMQSRPLPNILLDKQTGVELDGTLADEGAGVIDIRTVYDIDGAFNNLGSGAASIAALADPAQTLAADRPARFLRIVKAVGIPDEDVKEIPEYGLRPQHPAENARDRRLCADRAGRFGQGQGAGERAACTQRARWQWPPHRCAPSVLGTGPSGRDRDMQWLSQPGQRGGTRT